MGRSCGRVGNLGKGESTHVARVRLRIYYISRTKDYRNLSVCEPLLGLCGRKSDETGIYYPTFVDSHNSLNLASITFKISVIGKTFLNLAL